MWSYQVETAQNSIRALWRNRPSKLTSTLMTLAPKLWRCRQNRDVAAKIVTLLPKSWRFGNGTGFGRRETICNSRSQECHHISAPFPVQVGSVNAARLHFSLSIKYLHFLSLSDLELWMTADPCIDNRSSYEHDDKAQLSAPKASELRYLSYQHDQAITVGHINARKCSKLYGDFENFALCELIVSPDFQQKLSHFSVLLPPVLVKTWIKII